MAMRSNASHWERSAGEDQHIGAVILIVLIGAMVFGAFVFWQMSGNTRAPDLASVTSRPAGQAADRPGSGYKAPVSAAQAQPAEQAQTQPAIEVKPTVQPTAAPTPATNVARVAHTDGVGVVLRSAPVDAARMPRGFMDGAEVTILERQGTDWVKVRGTNGQEGWIPSKYLDQ
jgi:hypothetical protein